MDIDTTKLFLLIMMVGASLPYSAWANPKNFLEFKDLPPKERDRIVSDENNAMHGKALRWWWRLHLGEDAWRMKEQERLIDKHNCTALKAFFLNYQHLQEQFLRDEWANKRKAGMSTNELSIQGASFDKMEKSVNTIYPKAIGLISSIAPTNALLLLNKEANEISIRWFNTYLSAEGQRVSSKDIVDIDNDEHRILDQLNSLPKLTPHEVEIAIEGLPEDYPQGHGLPIPRK